MAASAIEANQAREDADLRHQLAMTALENQTKKQISDVRTTVAAPSNAQMSGDDEGNLQMNDAVLNIEARAKESESLVQTEIAQAEYEKMLERKFEKEKELDQQRLRQAIIDQSQKKLEEQKARIQRRKEERAAQSKLESRARLARTKILADTQAQQELLQIEERALIEAEEEEKRIREEEKAAEEEAIREAKGMVEKAKAKAVEAKEAEKRKKVAMAVVAERVAAVKKGLETRENVARLKAARQEEQAAAEAAALRKQEEERARLDAEEAERLAEEARRA